MQFIPELISVFIDWYIDCLKLLDRQSDKLNWEDSRCIQCVTVNCWYTFTERWVKPKTWRLWVCDTKSHFQLSFSQHGERRDESQQLLHRLKMIHRNTFLTAGGVENRRFKAIRHNASLWTSYCPSCNSPFQDVFEGSVAFVAVKLDKERRAESISVSNEAKYSNSHLSQQPPWHIRPDVQQVLDADAHTVLLWRRKKIKMMNSYLHWLLRHVKAVRTLESMHKSILDWGFMLGNEWQSWFQCIITFELLVMSVQTGSSTDLQHASLLRQFSHESLINS